MTRYVSWLQALAAVSLCVNVIAGLWAFYTWQNTPFVIWGATLLIGGLSAEASLAIDERIARSHWR